MSTDRPAAPVFRRESGNVSYWRISAASTVRRMSTSGCSAGAIEARACSPELGRVPWNPTKFTDHLVDRNIELLGVSTAQNPYGLIAISKRMQATKCRTLSGVGRLFHGKYRKTRGSVSNSMNGAISLSLHLRSLRRGVMISGADIGFHGLAATARAHAHAAGLPQPYLCSRKIALGIIPCTPTVPSTTWVTW